eukprot:2902051-Rhodomonas_salina.1
MTRDRAELTLQTQHVLTSNASCPDLDLICADLLTPTRSLRCAETKATALKRYHQRQTQRARTLQGDVGHRKACGGPPELGMRRARSS